MHLWKNDAAELRKIAAKLLETHPHWLKHWWSDFYKRPMKDPLLLEYTPEELMVEYLQHAIHEDPMEAYPKVDATGTRDVAFRTHDPVVASWEKAVQDDKPIDFRAAVPDSEKHIFDGLLKRSKALAEARQFTKKPATPLTPIAPDPLEFNDNYSEG